MVHELKAHAIQPKIMTLYPNVNNLADKKTWLFCNFVGIAKGILEDMRTIVQRGSKCFRAVRYTGH